MASKVCARVKIRSRASAGLRARMRTRAHISRIHQRAWWRDAKLMLFAIALSLNLPGCTGTILTRAR